MHTSTRKNSHAKKLLNSDFLKIKSALYDTSYDIKSILADKYSESVGDMKTKSKYVAKKISTYTTDRPFKSLSMAALAGFVFGFIYRK